MRLPEKRHDLPEPKNWYRLIGPGAIMVATSLGSGEIYFWPHLSVNVGAWILLVGVTALWMQYVMNTEISRYTLATGETVLRGFHRLWKPLPWIIMVCCTIPWIWPGWAMGGAVAVTWILGGSAEWFGVASLVLAGVLLSVGRTLYRTLEVTQLVLIAITMVCGLWMFGLTRAYLAVPDTVTSLSAEGIGKLGDIDLVVILTALAFCGAGGTINLTQSNYIKEKRFGMAACVPQLLNPLARGRGGAGEPAGADGPTEGVEGYIWEANDGNVKRWKAWWKQARTEQFVTFFLVGCTGLLLLSLVAVRLIGDQDPQTRMDLLRQEMTSAASLWPSAGTIFAVLVVLVFCTTEIGVLDHVCRLVADICTTKGIVKTSVRWRTEGAVYLYTLWAMILGGVFILLGLNIKAPPRLLVIAGSLSGLAMFIYTVAVIFLNRSAGKEWRRVSPATGDSVNPFVMPLWRTVVLIVACLMFGVLSLVVIGKFISG